MHFGSLVSLVCSSAAFCRFDYVVPDFYGFRGEMPFEATFERQDYSGFQSLKCVKLTVTTQAASPAHLAAGWLKLDGREAVASRVAQRARFSIRIPGEELLAIIWRDIRNETFASGETTMSIPLDRLLTEASSDASARCGLQTECLVSHERCNVLSRVC